MLELIYARTRTFRLPAVYIYMEVRKFLDYIINSRVFMPKYIYIYVNSYAFGCPVSGHRTPWLSQLNYILWFIFLQKQVF